MNFIARVRYWLLLIPLLALLALTYWLNQQVRPDSIKLDNTSRHQPDAIVENFSAIKLGVQGTPSLIIAAQKMLHFPDGDSTTLEMPHITSLSAERPTIHISAKRGILSSKGDEIFLHDNVEILREDSAHRKIGSDCKQNICTSFQIRTG